MKKVLLSMAAVGALAAAAPAVAQTNYNSGGAVAIDTRIAQLESRLQAGIQARVIDRAEAQDLRMQLRELRRLDRQYSMNGLTRTERADLQARIRDLRADMRLADGGRFDRDNRYGSWEDREYDDRYSSRVDRNRDGWDDRDSDRDGRWDDDNRGQGGPYEEVCQTRGGIGGIIENVLGAGNNCAGLRVGQRVSGNLGSVPYEYRSQFRDGGGVYYRSDGRAIYQIDARSDTVLRVYSMNR